MAGSEEAVSLGAAASLLRLPKTLLTTTHLKLEKTPRPKAGVAFSRQKRRLSDDSEALRVNLCSQGFFVCAR